jgi:hypothetical protein
MLVKKVSNPRFEELAEQVNITVDEYFSMLKISSRLWNDGKGFEEKYLANVCSTSWELGLNPLMGDIYGLMVDGRPMAVLNLKALEKITDNLEVSYYFDVSDEIWVSCEFNFYPARVAASVFTKEVGFKGVRNISESAAECYVKGSDKWRKNGTGLLKELVLWEALYMATRGKMYGTISVAEVIERKLCNEERITFLSNVGLLRKGILMSDVKLPIS